ncbi:MAG: Cof-type HAD-IIB family hydrolase [Bacilli bacterium]|nr:Cof-type HAD-IIB family hydrolase [Bacilli bacterium]
MQKKLIAIDMDGTLLNDKLEIMPKTKEILRRLTKEGHVVMISSGRPFRSIERYYDDLGLKSPVICLNGMKTFSPRDDSFPVLEFKFKKEDVIDIATRCHDILLSCMSESDTKTYQEVKDDYLSWFFPFLDLEIGRMGEILKEDVKTAIWNCSEDNLDFLKSVVNEHYPMVWRKWTGSSYSEAYLDNVNKGMSMKYVQEHLGIGVEDTIAFGDSINDFEMLDRAALGFIMKNTSLGYVPEKYKITREDNNHEGIYETLMDLGL